MIGNLFKYLGNFFFFYSIFFIVVIFSNFAVGSFVLTDFIFLFLVVNALIKTSSIRKNNSVYFYVAYFVAATFLIYASYHNTRGLLSSFRFVIGMLYCSIFYSAYNNNKYRSKVIDGYCYACVFLSLFVIVQFMSYYVFKVNINFSFGDYSREMNVAGSYDAFSDLFYRTGGMFKEPSWYAAFVTPVCFILTHSKRTKELVVVLLGLLMSTSGLGFSILAIYFVWVVLKFNRKLGVFLSLMFGVVYYFLPFIFNKTSGGVAGGNSSFEVRILKPLQVIMEIPEFSIFGLDPSYHYDNGGNVMFFANTLTFIYLYFGIIGMIIFFKFVYFERFFVVTISIIAIIATEGLYGRIEFWMMVLACKLYYDQIRTNEMLLISK